MEALPPIHLQTPKYELNSSVAHVRNQQAGLKALFEMLMHILPHLCVSQLSKYETVVHSPLTTIDDDQFSLFEKESTKSTDSSSTRRNCCQECRYFENLSYSSSFNKFSYPTCNCPHINHKNFVTTYNDYSSELSFKSDFTNIDTLSDSDSYTSTRTTTTTQYNFDSYHPPIMVLPTSSHNSQLNPEPSRGPSSSNDQSFMQDYLLNSLFAPSHHHSLNHFLSNSTNNNIGGVTTFAHDESNNLVFPDKNRKSQNEKKGTTPTSSSSNTLMTILPKQQHQPIHNLFQQQDSMYHTHHSIKEEKYTSEEEDASSSSCVSNNSSVHSNQSFTQVVAASSATYAGKQRESANERAWKIAYESDEYKGLLRNTSFKIKTRTDDIEAGISSQLYSSLKYQFNISTFVNKKRANELAIIQKSYGGIIIATVESLIVRGGENDDDDEDSDEEKSEIICQDVLKGELELALQPIESIEATESKAFKPFLQQLRREINNEENECDENDWICLLNKTKMQFSDQSQHNKKSSYMMRVSFYLNKEFKERKPIIIFESAPFKIYARRSKKLEETEEPKKRKRKIKTKNVKKQKSNPDDPTLLSKFESEMNELVQFIGGMTNVTERNKAVQTFITNLISLDTIRDAQLYIEKNQPKEVIVPQLQPITQPITYPNMYYYDTNPFFVSNTYSNVKDESSLESSISKDMLMSIGQASVLDSPHTPDLSKGSEPKQYNQPPRIFQLLNQPSRLDLSKMKNIGSMNASMLNKYLQDDVQTPTNSQPSSNNNLVGSDNSFDLFDMSPLPIHVNNNGNGAPASEANFEQMMSRFSSK